MRDIIRNHISNSNLEGVVGKLSRSDIGNEIRKRCTLMYPLKSCLIEKVKVLRKPKKDVAKLMQIHDLKHGFDALKEAHSDDEDEESESMEETESDDE